MIIPSNIIEQILNIVLINNKFIFINLWSVVHLITGGLIYKYVVQKWYKIFALLILYEIFEMALWNILFKPELITDIIWDIIIGMLGAYIVYKISS